MFELNVYRYEKWFRLIQEKVFRLVLCQEYFVQVAKR